MCDVAFATSDLSYTHVFYTYDLILVIQFYHDKGRSIPRRVLLIMIESHLLSTIAH
jgi:hypothetical protein